MIKKRMEEIQTRMAAIDAEIAQPNADIKALEEETRKLADEYKELEERQKAAETRKAILSNVVTSGIEVRKAATNEPEDFSADSPAYRRAFLKDLKGETLTVEERTAMTASAAIPTQTMNKIIGRLKEYPIISAIEVMHIPSNVSMPVESAVNDASWVAMGTASTDSKDALATVTLTAYKLIKTVEITADVAAMAIDAFEDWLVSRLVNKINKAMAIAIIQGTGSSQATGVITTISTATGTFTKGGMTYKDLMKIIASLPTEYSYNASFVMPRKVFYEEVIGMEDTTGQPVVVADAQAPGKFNILGYPVIIEDSCTASGVDNVLFGDFFEYKWNFAQDIEVAQDKSVGFRTGSTVYRAMCLADGKLADTNAIVRYTRAE